MGLGVNLVRMLGLPDTAKCPKCDETVATFFDDYDLDDGDPNPDDGSWRLDLSCHACEHAWVFAFTVRVVEVDDEEDGDGDDD